MRYFSGYGAKVLSAQAAALVINVEEGLELWILECSIYFI